jgi:hypothetical protein
MSIDKARFRSETNSRYTRGLFYETTLADKSTVVYTLKDQDHLGYPSLYRLYMETGDPTEWRFAQEHLDGWDHWELLCGSTWFKPYVERWRKELDLKLASEALHRILKESKTNSREGFAANKYILEKGWQPKGEGTTKRGRPSKEQITKEAARIADEEARLNDDFNRVLSIN